MTENNGLHLLDLPDLVLEKLIKYFSPDDYPTLRLVCKATKAWIEDNPKILKNLQVTITSEEVFNEITRSNTTVPWSNFKFQWESVFTKPKLLGKFLKKFGPSIRIFDFLKCACEDHYSRNDAIIDIILSCPYVESLKLCELSCKKLQGRKDSLEILRRNWENLKCLQIQLMLCNEYFGIGVFGEILRCCDSLEELNPPIITISSPEYLSFNYKLFFKNYVVKPIIDYLKYRRRSGNNLKKLHVQEYLFDIDPDLLYELAHVCYHCGTVLYPETFLPFSTSKFLKLPESKGYILQTLGSLGGINDIVMTMSADPKERAARNLEFLSVSFRSFFISKTVLETCPMNFPNLKEVEIEMTNDPPWNGRPTKMSVFMRQLSSTRRPGVSRLNLVEVSRAKDTTMIRAVCIVGGFPNLKKLEVTNWDGESAEFLTLWNGLQALEDVQLKFCPNLGDEGIIGPKVEQPPMLMLKWLKYLSLSDCGTITDLSYVYVFRHLKLKKFHHYTSAGSLVTKVGYNALAKGIFCQSIHEMMIQCSSEFKEMDQFCNFLRQFPNLTKPRSESYAFQSIPQKQLFSFKGDSSASRSCCHIC